MVAGGGRGEMLAGRQSAALAQRLGAQRGVTVAPLAPQPAPVVPAFDAAATSSKSDSGTPLATNRDAQ